MSLPPATVNASGFSVRDNARVHIGNNYHLSPGICFENRKIPGADRKSLLERPENPPSPLSTVPFRRDRDYIHRPSLITEIDKKLSVPAARVAIVGLGGIGKSQLAIEYCYQVRARSPETWVFWIHASSAARFEQSVDDTLDRLKVTGRDKPEVNSLQLFRRWLNDSRKGKWLLVLDNVDDARFLLEAPTSDGRSGSRNRGSAERRIDFLPQEEHGSMLITSRSRYAALEIVDAKDVIDVQPMDEAQAVALLKQKIGAQCDGKDIPDLAQALECMPLALVQAAAYLQQRGARTSVAQHVEKLRKGDEWMLRLLGDEKGDIRRDREASNSIVLTWQISFEHIQEIRPSAADLLSLMSFFDRQGIPDYLLRERNLPVHSRDDYTLDVSTDNEGVKIQSQTWAMGGHKVEKGSSGDEDERFEQDLSMLQDYSFISLAADNITTFQMHALVQLATQRWLIAKEHLERWKCQFLANLSATFPRSDFESWEQCQLLYPHAKNALSTKLDGSEATLGHAILFSRSAAYALKKVSFGDAKSFISRLIDVQVRELGMREDDREVLMSKGLLSRILIAKGQLREAEALSLQVVDTLRRVFGDQDQDTLTNMATLAIAYNRQEKLRQAEQLEVHVVEARKSVLGDEHSETLGATSNLAITYKKQGRWHEAENLQKQVLEAQERVLSREHPDILGSMNNLGLTFGRQGRWRDAVKIQEQVLEVQERVLGREHPDTFGSVENLARSVKELGHVRSALNLMAASATLSEKVLGVDHPETIERVELLREWTENFNEGSTEQQDDRVSEAMSDDYATANTP